MIKPIRIALTKGRLEKDTVEMFERLGYDCTAVREKGRRLILPVAGTNLEIVLAKAADVATYVDNGVCDIGVVGKDVLLESEPDLYELLDLKLGSCHLAVAAKNGYVEDEESVLRVATKYPHVAQSYYESLNRQIEIIKLNGSIELAPILGLSDVIVDIVETGTTLKENNLFVMQKIVPSSARLVANKSSYKFKGAMIDRITALLKGEIAND